MPANQGKAVTNNTRPFKQKHPVIEKLINLRSLPAYISKYRQLTRSNMQLG